MRFAKIKSLALITALALILSPQPALAEYRAFELLVTNQLTGKEILVRSTLDHLQYATYYPLKANETIEYVRSWMCYGDTGGFLGVCPPPSANTAPTKNQN